MRIKKLRLRNIRSYTEAELDFPEEGSILLSGNIGSGKSSVLLAIDFALFGLQRGELSGNALLRNGEDSGEVELTFLIEGKEVTVSRGLKRSASGVSQDSGSISCDGVVKQATALELKQDILDLLNYPSELLSKSKHLIFRYTVYTPQEEMKQILFGDNEIRLNTLRKVFGIDKYKRIVENSAIVSSWLREEKKELAAKVSDLPLKQQELASKESNLAGFRKELDLMLPTLREVESSLHQMESFVKEIEQKMTKVREIKAAHTQCMFEMNHALDQKNKLTADAERLEKEIASFSAVQMPDTSSFGLRISEIDSSIAGLEAKSKEISDRIQDAKTKVAMSNRLISQISSLNQCPTCGQEVSDVYKGQIFDRESSGMKSLAGEVEMHSQELGSNSAELAKLKQGKEALVKSMHECDLIRLRLQSFNDKKQLLESLRQQCAEVSGRIKLFAERKESLAGQITEDYEIELQRLKMDREKLLVNEKGLVAKKASLETSISSVSQYIGLLQTEISMKKSLSERVGFLSGLRDWLDDSFVTMVSSMERSVMMRVHKEFNDLFSSWFKMLVDSEDFEVRLDSEFTPVIEQNGYGIEYPFLSGGEKTAAALAYRLALNQVTNSLVSTIKTRDLLILDEPTDGFSSEQLDRMRAVLEQMKMGQIIIVSHEAKIESMVDRVIRFAKNAQKTVISC